MVVAIGEAMKTLALGLALAFASAGCLGSFVPDPKPASVGGDMAHAGGTGGNGGTGGTGGGGGGENNASSTDMSNTASTDLAGVTPGTKAFGDLCTVAGDCQSTLCE